MTRHSTVFEAERPIPVADAAKDLLPGTHNTPASEVIPPATAPKKFNFRKLLMTGAAVAALAGAAWDGWNYWPVGQYPVSTDDALVKADHPTTAPQQSAQPRQTL